MKFFYAFIFSCFLFSSCKKNNDAGVCRVSLVRSFTNGTLYNTANYEYDDGRIKKISNSNANSPLSITFSYFSDSIVVSQNDMRTVYFLNNAGLATSAKTYFSVNPDGFQFDYVYTYNTEGYLIQEREIFSQIYYGNVVRDTNFTNYTVLNGNIIKETATNSTEEQFEYSQTRMPENDVALNPFPSHMGKFLGKSPINLISKSKNPNGNEADPYSYSFDPGGKVKILTVGTSRNEFSYQCN